MTRLHRFSCTALLSLALSGGVLAMTPAYAATASAVQNAQTTQNAPAASDSATTTDAPGPAALLTPPGDQPHDFGWQ
ncbi:hypothetical protein ABZ695_11225 [Streptomyces sp. NPDC006976]|uniref:hypothetical protein n=1 Tax=Streptomyces sp. NPDC006976 TaxID=3154311 RepID=UPI0033CAB383